jgi:signal peptidase I
MRPRRIRKLVSVALGLIVLGFAWFYLAPVPFGGSATYVVTHGVSMEPRFHSGDLAIVRSQSSYHVGEVVAYHNHQLHTIVLHRIIGREGDRYLFKGDNNSFVDPEHPVASQLIGALWLHIAGAGIRLQSIRSPIVMGALLFLGVLLLTGGVFTRGRRRRRGHGGAGASVAHAPGHPWRPARPALVVVVVGLLALVPFLLLALLAFTRAPSERSSFTIPYKQSGALSYTADATPGPVYPENRVVTGEPLFTQVLTTVEFRFSYRFESTARHALTGNASLSATLTSTSGWHTTLALGAPTYFRGDHALVTGTLDLPSLLALVRSFETTTKSPRGSYTLAIVPHVKASGSADQAPLHTTFSPEVRFLLSEYEAQPAASERGPLGAAQPATNPFDPSKAGSAQGSHLQPLSLSLGLARVSVETARTLALSAIAIIVGALLAILALIRPILAFMAPRRRDESAAILAHYRHLIVPVARISPPPGVPVIDVGDIDALARIAEHYDRSILHEATDRGESFWVTDESGQFRYAPSTQAFEHQPAAVAAAADQVTAQHRTTVEGEQGAQDAISPAEDWRAGDDPSLDESRAQARAAFASVTGLRWTAGS